ncbi:MAG: thioredoxin [Lachnospiraceae bacterium]|nr:thioredoxin [Lachnospiraceae bacterium]
MSEVMLTKENFEEEVVKSELPVLVDFYAEWCGPCKSLSPLIAEIAEEYKGKIKVCKVNIDEDGGLSDYYNVMSVPTLMMYKGGEQTGMMVGYRPKKDIVKLFS